MSLQYTRTTGQVLTLDTGMLDEFHGISTREGKKKEKNVSASASFPRRNANQSTEFHSYAKFIGPFRHSKRKHRPLGQSPMNNMALEKETGSLTNGTLVTFPGCTAFFSSFFLSFDCNGRKTVMAPESEKSMKLTNFWKVDPTFYDFSNVKFDKDFNG